MQGGCLQGCSPHGRRLSHGQGKEEGAKRRMELPRPSRGSSPSQEPHHLKRHHAPQWGQQEPSQSWCHQLCLPSFFPSPFTVFAMIHVCSRQQPVVHIKQNTVSSLGEGDRHSSQALETAKALQGWSPTHLQCVQHSRSCPAGLGATQKSSQLWRPKAK